ncbi:hypothetical protein H4Q26_003555 [Puccinia striiformis f. sp. tritici PST-130]|nr:hypothetical protein H4Q26_003555 [Puccinia striiformis f. sp. tritici PST-130]
MFQGVGMGGPGFMNMANTDFSNNASFPPGTGRGPEPAATNLRGCTTGLGNGKDRYELFPQGTRPLLVNEGIHNLANQRESLLVTEYTISSTRRSSPWSTSTQVFRALGIIPDKDILEHICYDRNDTAMFEMLKPCLEDSFPIQEQEKRNSHRTFLREKIKICGRNLTERDVTTYIHVRRTRRKKAYFFGYMIHRLLLAALDRRDLEDRDHFGKKRLDLAGPLLAGLFRMLFRKLTKDVYCHLQKCVETQKPFNLNAAVKLLIPLLVSKSPRNTYQSVKSKIIDLARAVNSGPTPYLPASKK